MDLRGVSSEDETLKSLARLVQQRSSRRREPRRIADAINRLLARRGYAHQQSSEHLQAVWSEAAGPALSRHSRPALLKRGVLEIVVRSSTVLQELTFEKSHLLKRLQAIEGGDAIRNLRFRIGSLD